MQARNPDMPAEDGAPHRGDDRRRRRRATSWSSSRARRSSPSTSTRRSASRARAARTCSTRWCARRTSSTSSTSAKGCPSTRWSAGWRDVSASPLDPGDEGDELWNLALEAARLDEIVDQAVRTLEPAVVAKYAFWLAQAFNGVYHQYPDPRGGAPGAPRLARRDRQPVPPAADARARPDGRRRAGADVTAMPALPSRRPPDARRRADRQAERLSRVAAARRRRVRRARSRACTIRARVLAHVDGLMLLGGHDVDPSLYGEAPHPTSRRRRRARRVRARAGAAARRRAICRSSRSAAACRC